MLTMHRKELNKYWVTIVIRKQISKDSQGLLSPYAVPPQSDLASFLGVCQGSLPRKPDIYVVKV